MCSKGKSKSKNHKILFYSCFLGFGRGQIITFETRTRKILAPFDWFCSYQYKKTDTTLETPTDDIDSNKELVVKKTIKEYHLCTLPAHVNRPRPPAGAKSKHQEQPKYPKPAKRTLPKCPQLFSLNAFNQQRNHC